MMARAIHGAKLLAGAATKRAPTSASASSPWSMAVAAILLCLASLLGSTAAHAGVMTRESMEKIFPLPLIVGEKDSELPVWPILKDSGKKETPIIAYVFESIDFAPIPGFSGTPINLLIALGGKGEFMDVRVLSQHEPMFTAGVGEGPMLRFIEQYKGLSLLQNIKIGSNLHVNNKAGSANAYIDGITKATSSVRIINQSLLTSSLKVARAKMGYATGRDPDLVARISPAVFAPMDWDGLVKAGLITKKTFRNRDIDQAFVGTVGEGLDEEGARAPDDSFIDLYFAYLDVPSVGRNLLTPEDWQRLHDRLEPGDHALLVIDSGRNSILGDDFVRGSVPDHLTLRQQNLPLGIRDLDFDANLRLPPALRGTNWRALRVIASEGLDPAQALDFSMRITRSKGVVHPDRENKDFAFSASLPERYFVAASADNKGWHSIWSARLGELAVLVAGLAILVWVLRNQRWLSYNKRRLAYFRTGYLLFTLCFIGWYAQGQLSIVNLTALLQAAIAGRSLGFFFYDPMTVLLWGFVVVTFFIWGRGTFCGWLCPFGALQEFMGKLAGLVRLRQIRFSDRTDGRLKKVKYGILAFILVVACFSAAWTDRLVEVEPFKTSITSLFDRTWPFVLWAGALIMLSAFVYKGYCRYLCPLGAGMALLGRLRRFDWIARRTECGQPCQRCRNDCNYQAIGKPGAIDYDECFQCLDCVAIHQNEQLCVPLIMKNRQSNPGTYIPIVVASAAGKPVQGEV